MNLSKKKLAFLTACVISAVSNCAFAEELETYDSAEYVVTATRAPLEKKEVPQTVEVITKEEIQNLGVTTVRQALETATGLVVAEAAAMGDNITLRGGSTDDVLFLINGRRIAGEPSFPQASSNGYIVNRLNLSNVERIEVLRGQAGALYGSDAQSGVINIITKKSEKPGFSVGFTTGTRSMSNYYHIDTGRDGKVSATFDVNLSKLRHFSNKAGSNFMEGPAQSYTLDTDFEMDENNKLNLYLDYTKENRSQYISAYTRNISAYTRYSETDRKTAVLTYTGKNDNSEYTVSANYSRLNKNYTRTNPSSSYVSPTQRDSEVFILEARDSIMTSDNNKVTVGAEYRYNNGSTYSEGSTNDTKQWAAYVQDEWKIGDKLLLIPSVRYDHHDSFGSHTSPNLGLTYFISDSQRFKANYGSAYRAPSVDELYGTCDMNGAFYIYGNPDLKPEKTKGYELSYEQEFSENTSAKLTYFRNEKEDALSYESLGTNSRDADAIRGTDMMMVNIDKVVNEGIEFELKQNLGNGLTLSANYSWLDSRDDDTGKQLGYTAKNTYNARLTWVDPVNSGWSVVAWNKWYTNFNSSGYGSSTENLVSGNTFHFTVSKRWDNDKYRAFFGIDNLFDKELDALYLYGRMWRCGFEMSF